MANEVAKLKFLHKKIIDRYLEGPNSADEDIIKLMDLGVTNPQLLYSGLGYNEHPIYLRDQWVSQVAAKTTDDGYWSWVLGKISADKTYRITSSGIHERAETEATWSTSPFDVQGATAAPAPAMPPFPTASPTVPAMPRPRTLAAEAFDELMQVTAADVAPVHVQL